MTSIKNRNMGVQILLMIVTFGIYGIYWFYQTACELKMVAKNNEAKPGLWTVLLFVPFGSLYSWFMYSEMYENIGTEKINKWILFILWMFFPPAIWFLVQRDLNQWSQTALPA